MTTPVDLVGSQPISFTNTNGDQMVIPLSALEFSGGQPLLKTAWANAVPALLASQATINALAQALAAVGELTPPPTPPPAPALAFTATRTGPETNGVTVSASTQPGSGGPLTTEITIKATETDTWSGLSNGADAAHAMGTDAAPGTGLLVVKQNSFSSNAGLSIPTASNGKLQAGQTADLLESDNTTKVCTIQPRADYTGTAGLKYTVTPDAAGQSFTITATYDSSTEPGGTNTITLLTLSSLPAPVTYLVKASAPPTGAVVPADGSVQLSGGASGIAATGLLYT